MKILLVQVPTSHLGARERVYPLGLSRLSSLISPDTEKQVLDMNLHPDPWPLLRQRVTEFMPDVVMLSFRNLDPLAGHQTSYLSSLKTAARLVRVLHPPARIWAGGPAFSLFAERLMTEIPELDSGLRGEGEIAFPRMLAGDSPADIPGLLWRKSGKIHINPSGEKADMNILPPMDTTLFPPSSYLEGNLYVAAMGIEGKRGCDLQCGYCLYPFLGGRGMRLRDPEAVADEMEFLYKEHNVRFFHFTDSVLNRPADHFEAVCRAIINRDMKSIGWTGFFREDTINHAQCDLALKAGLSAIYFSGDALTAHGLKILGKRLGKTDLFRASQVTTASGVLTMCHFLVNLPAELPAYGDEARETLERILDIHAKAGNLGAVILNTVRIYPAAPLTRYMEKKGLLSPDVDLLYPVYYNPLPTSHFLHELQTRCHSAGVFSHLGIGENYNIRENL